MGANKTSQSTDRPRMLGDSPEFRRLRRAVGKAGGDRDLAIRNVGRLYGVDVPDALPTAIRPRDRGPARRHLGQAQVRSSRGAGVANQKP
jgi:hypothetical protein